MRESQKGMILYEAAVSIPVIAMLVMTAVTVFLWGVRVYFIHLADGELEQEVQIAFRQLMEDAMTAERIERTSGRQEYAFIKRNNPLAPERHQEETFPVTYQLHQVDGVIKLFCGGTDAPLTGNHALAPVEITEFTVRQDELWPTVYHLRLTGKSGVTDHEYSLCSAVCLSAR